MIAKNAAQQYQQNAHQGAEQHANPHRIVQMLMQGVIDKVSLAKGFMQHDKVSDKCANISVAISILDGLQSSLDISQGDIATNLNELYEYMMQRLLHANLNNDVSALDEVLNLMKEIKEGWDGIGEQANEKGTP